MGQPSPATPPTRLFQLYPLHSALILPASALLCLPSLLRSPAHLVRPASCAQSLPAADCGLPPAPVSTLRPRVQIKSQVRSIISTEQRWPLGGARVKGEKRDTAEEKKRGDEFRASVPHVARTASRLQEIEPDSRSGLNPRLDMAARDLALQPVDKFSTLAVHEIDELILLAAQHEDLLSFPAIETERRRSGIEFVERGEERAGEEGRREGQGTGGGGQVPRAVRAELERRGRTDNRYAEGNPRVCNARGP